MAGILYGAVVLSRELKRIALVKPQGCPVWCFPIGEVEGQSGVVAATSVVDKQTGIDIRKRICEEYIEVRVLERSVCLFPFGRCRFVFVGR